MNAALQRVTKEWCWGVVDAREPAGIRTVRGFVSVLAFCAPEGAPLAYYLVFFDVDVKPLDRFGVEDFQLFACAAGLALDELGLPHSGGDLEHIAELVVLAK